MNCKIKKVIALLSKSKVITYYININQTVAKIHIGHLS